MTSDLDPEHRQRAPRILQRFVLPADRDLDVVPLYVDTEGAMLDADKETIGTNKTAQKVNKASARQAISSGTSLHPDAILDRRRLRVEASQRISLGTYFNGFPASYWRRWTDRRRGPPRPDRHRRRGERDRLPLDGQRPLAARRRLDLREVRRRARRPST